MDINRMAKQVDLQKVKRRIALFSCSKEKPFFFRILSFLEVITAYKALFTGIPKPVLRINKETMKQELHIDWQDVEEKYMETMLASRRGISKASESDILFLNIMIAKNVSAIHLLQKGWKLHDDVERYYIAYTRCNDRPQKEGLCIVSLFQTEKDCRRAVAERNTLNSVSMKTGRTFLSRTNKFHWQSSFRPTTLEDSGFVISGVNFWSSLNHVDHAAIVQTGNERPKIFVSPEGQRNSFFYDARQIHKENESGMAEDRIMVDYRT